MGDGGSGSGEGAGTGSGGIGCGGNGSISGKAITASDSARQGDDMSSVQTKWAVMAADRATIIRPGALDPKLACLLAMTWLTKMFLGHPRLAPAWRRGAW